MESLFVFRPKTVTNILLKVFLFLFILNVGVVALKQLYIFDETQDITHLGFLKYNFIKFFDFDSEMNAPSAFSLGLFLASSCLLLVLGVLKSERTRSHYWFVLAGIFFFLGIDEFLAIHERLVDPMKAFFQSSMGTEYTTGILHHAWIVPYAILVLLLGIYLLRFFFSLSRRIQVMLVVAATIFLAGALGMEALGGVIIKHYGGYGLAYRIGTTFEETLEVMGLIYFIYALLKYLEDKNLVLSLDILEAQKAGNSKEMKIEEAASKVKVL